MEREYRAPAIMIAEIKCGGMLAASGDQGSTWTSGSIGGIDDGNRYSNSDFD